MTTPSQPTLEHRQGWRGDRWLLAIIVLAALLGLVYNGVMLPGKGPDEPRHMAYVKLLLDEHRLPFLQPDGNEYAGAHSFHPPLYYLLLLPLYALGRLLPGAAVWHAVRLGSLALCLAALPLIYEIACAAGGGDRRLARLATAQVALLPMWGMTAGTVNNDSATFFFVSLFLWMLVRYANDKSLRAALALGLCMGLGTLSKGTALLCDGVGLLAWFGVQGGWAALWQPRVWARLGTVAGCVVLLAGWWHWRSLQLYHTFTPLPPSMPTPLLPKPSNGPLVLLMHDHFPPLFAYANWSLLCTMWSQKDWIPEVVRQPIYWVLALYCAVGAGGSLAARWKGRSANVAVPLQHQDVQSQAAVWCTYTAFAANWVAVLQVAMFWHWGWAEGGRYLLPSFCGLSIFVARGWRGLVGSQRLSVVALGWVAGLIALNMLCVYWLLAYLNPTFG